MDTALEELKPDDGVTVSQPGLYRRLVTSQYIRQNALLLSANVLTGVVAYLLHPLLAHLLGLVKYGTVASLLALSAVLLTPVQITSAIAGKYASALSATGNLAQFNDLIRRLTAILLPVGIVAALVFTVSSKYIAEFFHLSSSQGVVWLGLVFTVAFASPINLGALQGLQRFGWLAFVTFLPLLLRLVLSAALVLLGWGVDGAVLAIVIANVVTYLVTFEPLRPILRGPRMSIGPLRPVWSYALLAAVAGTGSIFLYNVDTVLARHFLSAREAGLYAATATLGRTVLFVTSSLGIVTFPKVAALHERGERIVGVLLQGLLGALVLSAAVEVVLFAAPALVVRILLGPTFAAIAPLVGWYGLAMLLLAVAGIVMTYFLAVGSRAFVLPLLSCCMLQAALIVVRHSTASQLVQAVVTANAVLVITLLVLIVVRMRWDQELRVSWSNPLSPDHC
jgi:O-antigen/teichoic acid export membrane protein